MWNLFSFQNNNSQPPIRPELIYMALNDGVVAPDDHLARSFNTLPDIVAELPPDYHPTSADALPLERLNEILERGYNGLEHGYVRLPDWTWYLACKTPLRNCTGEMIEWWFNHCDNSERFHWTHPLHHTDGGEYDPSFYAVQPEDSKSPSLLSPFSSPPSPLLQGCPVIISDTPSPVNEESRVAPRHIGFIWIM
jgi:hypothetical protein